LEVFVSLRFAEYGRELDIKKLPMLEERDDRGLTPPEVLGRAIQKKKSLLLLGGPGSGKTTLLKYFSICCLDVNERPPASPPAAHSNFNSAPPNRSRAAFRRGAGDLGQSQQPKYSAGAVGELAAPLRGAGVAAIGVVDARGFAAR